MTNYKAFRLNEENPKLIWVEVSPASKNGSQAPAQENDKGSEVQTFSEAMEHVRSSAEVIINNLNKITNGKKPSEINLEFGIKLDPKVGAVVTQTEAETNYKIKLKWKNNH